MTYPAHLVAAYDRDTAATRDALDQLVTGHRVAAADHGEISAHVTTFRQLDRLDHEQLAALASIAITRLAQEQL